MAAVLYATNKFPGNGVTTQFEFAFSGGYLAKGDVKAYIENNTTFARTAVPVTEAMFVNASTLNLGVSAPVGSTMVVYRDTPKTAPLVDFVGGSRITESNLDKVAQQSLFIGAETADATNADAVANIGVSAGTASTASAAALVSQNAAAASATTASTAATSASTSATAAANSASSAGTSATAAAASDTNALASKNAAAVSATNAATSETNALASKNSAATSETNALASKNAATTSETNALASKNAAATSATNAATSEINSAANAAIAATAITVPQAIKSAAYTLVAADVGKHLLHPSADITARTFTIPSNAAVPFAISSPITFVNQNGAGSLTIAIDTDTMRLAGTGATGSRTLAPNGIATAIKLTATEWLISGVGLT